MSFEYVSNSTCSTLKREHAILFPGWIKKIKRKSKLIEQGRVLVNYERGVMELL